MMNGKFIKGAFLLTAAGLISKILSAGYRIPLQNLTGDIGFYIYQQVYPILGIILILSLYGFPSAISRIIVDLKDRKTALTWNSLYLPILLLTFCLNGIFFIALYFAAPYLAWVIGDFNLITVYQTAAVAFLFVPVLALFRGVFQGSGEMKYTAYSQVGEQTVRVILIITVAYFVAYKGLDVYKIGTGATFASILGASAATCIVAIPFIKKRHIVKTTNPIPWRYYAQTLVAFGVVASMNHMVLLLLQLVDVLTLVPQLIKHGLTSMEAMAAKGILDRGQPLIQLGTVLGSSFALASIPVITRKKLTENRRDVYDHIETALKYSFYLAAGAAVGLIVLFPETNALLYENEKGTSSLQVLVGTILFSSMCVTILAILQGLGYMKRTAAFILIVVFVKGFLNYTFVPLYGIYGSALATTLSMTVLFLFVYIELKRKLAKLTVFRNITWTVFLRAILSMIIYLYVGKCIAFSFLEMTRFALLIYVLFMVLSGGGLYLLLLLRGKAFTEKELSVLPFASVFIRIHKGRD
ncbi:putative polysaccharide biosynthesis protein [Virgibacillus sp. W0430]|uniref:putative polysaccharide biosynthesis protein n=1 Tax=Virgibacillus sp. W0430 TaxID=3391580 RepID=UPI003F48A624